MLVAMLKDFAAAILHVSIVFASDQCFKLSLAEGGRLMYDVCLCLFMFMLSTCATSDRRKKSPCKESCRGLECLEPHRTPPVAAKAPPTAALVEATGCRQASTL